MPVVRIDFDGKKVKKKEIVALSEAVHKIVSEATKIEDVPVYANSPQISAKISPIEIFIQLSENKIKDIDYLVARIKSGLAKMEKRKQIPSQDQFYVHTDEMEDRDRHLKKP